MLASMVRYGVELWLHGDMRWSFDCLVIWGGEGGGGWV